MRRKEILKDYKLEPTEVGGKIKTIAVYVGDKFSYAIDKKELRAYRIIIPILLLFSLASILVPMLLNSLSAKTWYIVLPGIIALFVLVITVFKASSIYSRKEFLTRKEYSEIDACKKPLIISRVFLLLIVLVTRIVFLSLNTKISTLKTEIINIAMSVFAINLSIFEFIIYNKIIIIQVTEEKNENSSMVENNNRVVDENANDSSLDDSNQDENNNRVVDENANDSSLDETKVTDKIITTNKKTNANK